MTTFAGITDTETGHKKPLTISLIRRLRDNLLATFEGSPGAPKLQPRALANGGLGGISFSATAWAGYTNLSTVARLKFLLAGSFISSVGIQNLRFRFSNDNGSTWGSAQNTGGGVVSGQTREALLQAEIDLVTGDYITTLHGSSSSITLQTGTLTPLSGCDAVQIGLSSGTSQFAGCAYVMAGR